MRRYPNSPAGNRSSPAWSSCASLPASRWKRRPGVSASPSARPIGTGPTPVPGCAANSTARAKEVPRSKTVCVWQPVEKSVWNLAGRINLRFFASLEGSRHLFQQAVSRKKLGRFDRGIPHCLGTARPCHPMERGTMTQQVLSERWIFEAAIEMRSPEERAAYLDQTCGSNEGLRKDVAALLAAHDRLPSIHPAAGAPSASATVAEPISERPGAVIGPYKLLEQIGEGGFGVVFMAEQQQPIRRKVALKVLKPGMDTRQVIARFEAERQALAMMDHPNIPKVLEGGQTASGRPYFVMDLVKGVPITEFCDQNLGTVRQPLDLFIHVCQAVQHAHQKSVIHPDLKPSNIMGTPHD